MPVTNQPFLPTALNRSTLPPSHFSPAGTWGAQHGALSEQTWAKISLGKGSWGALFTLIISLMWLRVLEKGVLIEERCTQEIPCCQKKGEVDKVE